MNPYTFIVRGRDHLIIAATALEAMSIANRTIVLPERFYAWMEAGPGRYQATTGVWD